METIWKAGDVAAAVNISVQTVYRYVAQGEIPFHRLKRAVRFKPSEIAKWFESRKAGLVIADCISNEKINGDLFNENDNGDRP